MPGMAHEDAAGHAETRRGGPGGAATPAGASTGQSPEADGAGRARPTGRAGLVPAGIAACLFDLDGVLTRTAKVHAAAWKEMFDAFLRAWPGRAEQPFRPFEIATDYARHVDGKLRADGVRSFLASRGIALPEGADDDPPTASTIHGLGARKNDLVLDLIRERGVEVYAGSVRFVEATRDAGLRRGVVSASKNCREVLVAAGIAHFFEVRVDGAVAAEEGLGGKPAPDMFLAAAARLGVEPARCAVFEDAIAGVEAGHAGGFGWVVGVNRGDQADALRAGGAHTVVDDLDELLEG
ncbi:MAG: Beta-phosphoglucomutase [uncultured Thermomicrobiales bacterium]|uniref:Beta-phosphoglucomutase n=1 Tax=uncultured Thermomicrobiales bacterium TaxID=1645740 RepID=A0A6J4V7W2_9BACT|nr:MAG: Beta-phosphoglucomutase [uncultured Thermomicrobiales bacterium]